MQPDATGRSLARERYTSGPINIAGLAPRADKPGERFVLLNRNFTDDFPNPSDLFTELDFATPQTWSIYRSRSVGGKWRKLEEYRVLCPQCGMEEIDGTVTYCKECALEPPPHLYGTSIQPPSRASSEDELIEEALAAKGQKILKTARSLDEIAAEDKQRWVPPVTSFSLNQIRRARYARLKGYRPGLDVLRGEVSGEESLARWSDRHKRHSNANFAQLKIFGRWRLDTMIERGRRLLAQKPVKRRGPANINQQARLERIAACEQEKRDEENRVVGL